MDVMAVLIGIGVLGAVIVAVIDIIDDGQRRRRPPRSHPEEVGSWVDQRLRP